MPLDHLRGADVGPWAQSHADIVLHYGSLLHHANRLYARLQAAYDVQLEHGVVEPG